MNGKEVRNTEITRRDFIEVTGAIVIVPGFGGCRATLESLELGYVADELEMNGKLGGM